MGARYLYLLAGILWALVLAPVAALTAIAAGAGFAWIFVFGDNPWPRWGEVFLLLSGAAAGVSAAAASIMIANAAAKAEAAAPNGNSVSAARHAFGMAIAPIIIALLASSALWLRARQFERTMSEAHSKEAKFADLVAASKKLRDLDIEVDSQGAFRAVALVSGSRSGAYELKWRIIPSSAKEAILERRRALRLSATTDALPILFSIDELKSHYQAIILRGRSGALVDERFRLEVSLNPIPTSEERQNLPPGEERRLSTSESPLESRRSTDFAVRFTIPP